MYYFKFILAYFLLQTSFTFCEEQGLPLYWWQQKQFVNFGDYLSQILVERIVDRPVEVFYRHPKNKKKKLLAIGSILSFAVDNDVVWGSGINGKLLRKDQYTFTTLDVRAVRGPLTRQYLYDNFGIEAPEVYGDPALLFPYFFPEFQKSANPSSDYIVIPHYTELNMFPKEGNPHIVYPTDPWDEVINRILDSNLVIASSLHGLIVAEAYGIPARLLKVTDHEPMFKYCDYYYGTNRPHFQYATSVEEALMMGGETPFECDLERLYEAFPSEFWPYSDFKPLLQR